MGIITKLQIEDTSLNILWFRFSFNQSANTNGYPSSKPTGGLWDITFETQKNDLFFNKLVNNEMINYLKIVITPAKLDTKSKTIELRDVHVIEHRNNFNGINSDPMKTYVKLSPASMVKNGEPVFVKYWKITDPNTDTAVTTTTQAPTPTVTSIDWTHPETKEVVEEITYGEDVALTAQIDNPEGNTAKIFITKEDGTEFEKGKTELTFEEAVTEDGYVELSTLKIKEKWETFKTANLDKLIAKIDHNRYQKKSKPLIIKPKAKAIVHFRPHATWAGEFGFDWLRKGDTNLDGDVDYETIIGKYSVAYPTESTSIFTKKNQKIKKLKKKAYKTIKIGNKKDSSGQIEKYSVPYLSIFKGNDPTKKYSADIELLTEVIDTEPNKLVIKYHKDYFDITTLSNTTTTEGDFKFIELNKKSVTSNTQNNGHVNSGTLLKETITIECIKGFDNDQYIEVYSVSNFNNSEEKTLAGKLHVIPNSQKHVETANIVFINVIANINAETSGNEPVALTPADFTTQTNYLNPFLKQALINPNIVKEDFNITNDNVLQQNYVTQDNGINVLEIDHLTKISEKGLIDYIRDKFNNNPNNKKYKKFYKVFFLDYHGGYTYKLPMPARGNSFKYLGGFARKIPSKECIMFANPQPFFVSHELMHCMNLYHSFDNKGDYTFKIGQTDNLMDYSHLTKHAGPTTLKQISTWKWQWDRLRKSNK